ncbi:MAG: DUF692 domain-containing protein [Flavobacteriaceae bacterium]
MQKKQQRLGLPNLGLGLGLRTQHFNHILEEQPKVDWFEVISENFMDSHGRPMHVLQQIKERYPVVMHGVSMSIGSTDPLNFDYLKKLKALAGKINPVWISDHLCWTGVLSVNSHDLLPVPLNEESLKHVCDRIKKVQDYLERPLVIENPSTYASFKHSTIKEWDFLRYMTEETGCGLLLDVNNVFVSAFNNDFNPVEYLEGIPFENVVQMHLAGHQHCGNYIVDTHDSNVTDQVWELFRLAWQKTGGVSTLLEWDGNIPAFDVYYAELQKAKSFMEGTFKGVDMEATPTEVAQAISNPIHVVKPEFIHEGN